MSYVIFGRKVLNEYLAIGTLSIFGGGVALAMSGGDKQKKAEVPIAAGSKDEEAFIRDFVANMEREDATAGHKH